jgi:hypothetical protein
MKLLSLYRIFGILMCFLAFCSCSSDLDFDQVNDVKLKPVLVANLANFDVKSSQFIINGSEQELPGVASDFNLFRSSYFRDSLKKAELFFEINNTINRAYEIDLIMLNQNDLVVHIIPLDVSAYTTGTTNIKTKTEVFENAMLEVLKSTTKIEFKIKMQSGPAINGGSLKLRSGATVYLELE